jgi:hypothetical protein
MPSRAWYIVAAIIGVGAIAAAGWLLVVRLGSIGAGLVQILVPGSADLELKTAGTYTIFHERTSQLDGRIYTSTDVSGLRVTVRDVAGGRELAMRRPAGSSTYDFGGRSGVAILAFTVETPGTHRLVAAYEDGRSRPQAVLAVGAGFIGGLVTTILLSVGLVMLGLAVAVLIVIVVVLKRRRAAAVPTG